MNIRFFQTFLLVILCPALQAQTFLVAPFVQNVTPVSAAFSWETSSGDESTVLWGADTSLGNSVSGTFVTGSSSSRIHEAEITGLAPDTRYFYRIVTGTLQSGILSFRTFPVAGQGDTVRIAVVSDCQLDTDFPDKLYEYI